MAVFEDLNGLNINGHTEKKNVGGKDLTYLSWPWAWAEVKKRYPDAHYTVWKNEHGLPYTEDPLTGYMVYTSVTIDGITHEMWLPVMDGANRAMRRTEYDYKVKNPNFKWAKWDEQRHGFFDKYNKEQPEFLVKHCDAATMMDINKTIMRCLVKNLAMFGLGLYIFAGEDLPEAEQEEQRKDQEEQRKDQEEQRQGQQTPGANVRPQNGPGNASVTTGSRVPPTSGQEAGNAPQAPETPGQYLMRRIGEMKSAYAEYDFNFGAVRKTLIDGGLVEDIPSAVMSMEQAQELIRQVEGFYEDRKAKRAS